MSEHKTDIAIIGGGATGCALALGLSQQTHYSVHLIDAGDAPTASSQQRGFDQRTLALSDASLRILAGLGVTLQNLHSTLIEHIHVSDKSHAGQVRLNASDYGIAGFGRVISLAALGALLYESLPSASSRFSYLANTTVKQAVASTDSVRLTLHDGKSIDASLVVLADGGRSPVGPALGFKQNTAHYGQVALTFNMTTSEPHRGWAYERFTQNGPLACLPLDANTFGVVWCVAHDDVDHWLQADTTTRINELQRLFGYRQGKILSLTDFVHYPLALRTQQQVTSHRTVAIGNAAQTLHPIAGQGVNLGFRDVADFVAQLVAKREQQLGCYQQLKHYADTRRKDKQRTIGLTDGLVNLFSNDHLPFVMGRNIGLSMMNISDDAKRVFTRAAMGY